MLDTFIHLFAAAFATLACIALAADIRRGIRHWRNCRNADKRAAAIWQETESD